MKKMIYLLGFVIFSMLFVMEEPYKEYVPSVDVEESKVVDVSNIDVNFEFIDEIGSLLNVDAVLDIEESETSICLKNDLMYCQDKEPLSSYPLKYPLFNNSDDINLNTDFNIHLITERTHIGTVNKFL